MRNEKDLSWLHSASTFFILAPILLDTGLNITCCAWNESGSILAICGQQRFACDSEPETLENIGVVQFYNPFGDVGL